MCKPFLIRALPVFCALIGLFFLTFPSTSPAQAIGPVQSVRQDSTPTANGSPTVTLAQPGVQGQFQGHPGTAIAITGSGFTAGATITIYTTPDNAAQCGPGTTNLQTLTTLNAQTDGSFAVPNGTTWPDNAAKADTNYYICAISNSNQRAISSAYFTVVKDAVAATTNTSINPGDSVTITGNYWLPAQSLTVAIVPAGQAGVVVSDHVTPNNNGYFSKQLTVPADTPPGSYGISVIADNETTLRYTKDGVITINAPTPTATAAPSPTPTPTAEPSPTPTPTPTPAATGDNGGSSSGGGPNLMPYVYGLGALGILLVLIGIIMFATYSAHGS